MTAAGFEIKVLKMIEVEPCYAMWSRAAFYPSMMWERILNASSIFENLRVTILCVARAEKGLPI